MKKDQATRYKIVIHGFSSVEGAAKVMADIDKHIPLKGIIKVIAEDTTVYEDVINEHRRLTVSDNG